MVKLSEILTSMSPRGEFGPLFQADGFSEAVLPARDIHRHFLAMPWECQGSSPVLPLPQPSSLGLTQPSLSMPSLSPRFLVLVSVDMEDQVLHSGEPREDMKAVRFKSLASTFCASNGSDMASICQQVLLGQSGLEAAFQRGRPRASRAIK